MRMLTARVTRVVVAGLAAAAALAATPVEGQGSGPRLVVFEEFMRPT